MLLVGQYAELASVWEQEKSQGEFARWKKRRRDGLKVHIQWGQDGDSFDPITQITNTTVVLELEENGKKREVIERAPQRRFTATEWRALVAASRDFDLVEQRGALDSSIPFSNDKKAWRMVSVLQKRTE